MPDPPQGHTSIDYHAPGGKNGSYLLAPGGTNGLKLPFSPWRQKWAQITL